MGTRQWMSVVHDVCDSRRVGRIVEAQIEPERVLDGCDEAHVDPEIVAEAVSICVLAPESERHLQRLFADKGTHLLQIHHGGRNQHQGHHSEENQPSPRSALGHILATLP